MLFNTYELLLNRIFPTILIFFNCEVKRKAGRIMRARLGMLIEICVDNWSSAWRGFLVWSLYLHVRRCGRIIGDKNVSKGN